MGLMVCGRCGMYGWRIDRCGLLSFGHKFLSCVYLGMCNGSRSLSLSCFKIASTNNKQYSNNSKAAAVFTIFTVQLMVSMIQSAR